MGRPGGSGLMRFLPAIPIGAQGMGLNSRATRVIDIARFSPDVPA